MSEARDDMSEGVKSRTVSDVVEHEFKATADVWDIIKVYKKPYEKQCMGKDGKCAHRAVARWACGDEIRDTCEECQEDNFDGWPKGMEPLGDPSSVFNGGNSVENLVQEMEEDIEVDENERNEISKELKENEDREPKSNKLGVSPAKFGDKGGNVDNINNEMQDVRDEQDDDNMRKNEKGDDDDDDNGDDGGEEQWMVEHMITIDEIESDSPIFCQTDQCKLLACAVWKSDKGEKWNSCLDCQEKDFGGWPDDQDFVMKSLKDSELVALYANECSKKSKKTSKKKRPVTVVTPPPGEPIPSIDDKSKSKSKLTASFSLVTPNQPKTPSASALAMHRKWQEAAEAAAGGNKDVRIVVSKVSAKRLIYDLLFDTYGVMNITDIYKKLKCIIPSPVLRTCLDDMALESCKLVMSDDEDDGASKQKTAKSAVCDYDGLLSMKAGRNPNTTLYYIDQNKLENCGNGLTADVKNKLIQDHQSAKQEEISLQSTLKEKITDSDNLLNQPTNQEADTELIEEEDALKKLREEVEGMRKIKVDAKARISVEKGIHSLLLVWRKRKRICYDFLRLMDESTEGTVSYEKCVKGDGQIDIESDESAIKHKLNIAKRKCSNGGTNFRSSTKIPRLIPKGKSRTNEVDDNKTIQPCANFVGLKLLPCGKLERVYFDAGDVKGV